jgi:hypothetical protein
MTWLRLAWIVLTFLVLSLFISAIPSHVVQVARAADPRALASLGISPSTYSAYLAILNLVVVLVHMLIAAIIFVRQPGDWMALFVAFTLVANGATVPLSQMEPPPGLAPGLWYFLDYLLIYIGIVSSVTVLYLFPTGRFVPRWTRWFAIAWALIILVTVFLPDSRLSLVSYGLGIQLVTHFIWAIVGVYAQVHRFQFVSTPVERQQTKWALLGLTAAAVGPAVYYILGDYFSAIQSPDVSNLLFQRAGASFFAFSIMARLAGATLVSVFLLTFPISFAIAILRYRLWDIDILIRRTLIYSTLSLSLAVVYLVSVVLLAEIFRSITGERKSALVVVFATLSSVALFTPLRHRIQNNIDRNFYRQKYDAEKTLEAFAHGLQTEIYIESLCEQVIDVVERTMQPESVVLWLRKREDETGTQS